MLVAFSSQKRGSGKTSSTMLVATYMTYYYNKKVGVVDCDIQKSLFNKRKDEIELLKILKERNNGELPPNLTYNKTLRSLDSSNKKVYDIISMSFDDENLIDNLIKIESDYDVVFIDFPGTLDFHQISFILLLLDYIFIPFYAEEKNFKSAFEFERVLRGIMKSIPQEKLPGKVYPRLINYYAYFFKYNSNTSKDEWNLIENHLTKINVEKLKNSIFENKRLENDLSTINIVSQVPKDKDPYYFVQEVMSKIFPNEFKLIDNELIELKSLYMSKKHSTSQLINSMDDSIQDQNTNIVEKKVGEINSILNNNNNT